MHNAAYKRNNKSIAHIIIGLNIHKHTSAYAPTTLYAIYRLKLQNTSADGKWSHCTNRHLWTDVFVYVLEKRFPT